MGSVNTAVHNTNFITMLNHVLNNISEKLFSLPISLSHTEVSTDWNQVLLI